MWGWTRLGARVFVTPGELSPESFSHPLHSSLKTQAPATTGQQSSVPPVGKTDSGAAELKSASAKADLKTDLDLKPTVGHGDVMAVSQETVAMAVPRDQTLTADASGNARADKIPVPTSDTQSVGNTPLPESTAKSNAPAEEQTKAAIADRSPKSASVPEQAQTRTAAANTDSKADKPDPDRAKAQPSRRADPISILVSRKDSKLYVRQNFAPLFDAPVTIAPGDRPLGTHVFTAEIDKNDPNVLHWSVVSPPVSARSAQPSADKLRLLRHSKSVRGAPIAEQPTTPVTDSPAEALDRITIAPDLLARIVDTLTTGSSVIVTDQGINQGETGEGTDFIVSLR
jgi:hypothetical protein